MTLSIGPQVTDTTMPLSELCAMALLEYGDANIDMADGNLVLLLMMYANQIVDEYNQHPYRTGMAKVNRYGDITEMRPIDDTILIIGMAARYAQQQGSEKASSLGARYYRTLNERLWAELNGNTAIKLRGFDKVMTDMVNGEDTEAGDE